MLARAIKHPAAREARVAAVHDEVMGSPELLDIILGSALHDPRPKLAHNAPRTVQHSKIKVFGKVSCVSKAWYQALRSQPDHLRKILGERDRFTGDLSKALSIAASKLTVYPHVEVHGVGGGKLFKMPSTFDAVLRDHGGWAGLLARSKSNAKRALAAEKTRIATKKAKEEEERRKEEEERNSELAGFVESVAVMAKDLGALQSKMSKTEDAAQKEKMRDAALEIANMLQLDAGRVLHVHKRE